MSEDRLTSLERDFRQLMVDHARLSESVEHLASAVTGLTGVVQEFRDTLNKGKGAVWLFGLVATALGAIGAWAMTRLFPA
jgi:hypothetical protein